MLRLTFDFLLMWLRHALKKKKDGGTAFFKAHPSLYKGNEIFDLYIYITIESDKNNEIFKKQFITLNALNKMS